MSEHNEYNEDHKSNQMDPNHYYYDAAVNGKRPVSEAKLIANRRNGALSRGPVSAEGKRRSSLNALRSHTHGQIVCLPAEELEVALKQTAAVRAEIAPVGPTEEFLATSIGENMWRISRIRAVEGGIFANGFRLNIDEIDAGHPEVNASLATADTWVQQAHKIMLLSTYESRLTSILRKDRADLAALQAARKEAHEKAMSQAEIFVEHAESKGETYEPGEDFTPAADHGGFVFSAPEIARRRDRKIRYTAASNYHYAAKNRKPDPNSGPKGNLKAA
jgi:hypothetical protein